MAAPSLLRFCGEILGGLFLYDFFFTLGHVALHRARVPWGSASGRRSNLRPLRRMGSVRVFQRLHGKHHANLDVRASDTVSLNARVQEDGHFFAARFIDGLSTVLDSIVCALCVASSLRLCYTCA